MRTRVKTSDELASMHISGRMLATVLNTVEKQIAAGVTTKYLADVAKQELRTLGGQPSFLGYNGFRDVLCVSVNEEVVHGIPGGRILRGGDIVSIDFGVTYKGMITDGARSVIVDGSVDPRDLALVTTTKDSLGAGIFAAKGDCRVGDISFAVQSVLKPKKYGIVRDLVGHGVGHELHEEPNIPNYGRKGDGPQLKTGMTIAIEPMATLGDYHVYMDQDGWTIKTVDNSRAAHFEHTILITEAGSEILTQL